MQEAGTSTGRQQPRFKMCTGTTHCGWAVRVSISDVQHYRLPAPQTPPPPPQMGQDGENREGRREEERGG